MSVFGIALGAVESEWPTATRWKYAVSVDTETTGSCNRSRIVQVAALRFRWRWDEQGEEKIEFSSRFRFVSLVRPPRGTPFHPRAVEITGIGFMQVINAPDFEEIAGSLGEVLADLPLVAHNAPFDRRMLAREWEACGQTPPDNTRWNCSMSRARAIHRGENYRLVNVAARMGIVPEGRLHDAGTDAELAARVWAKFDLEQIKNNLKLGIRPT